MKKGLSKEQIEAMRIGEEHVKQNLLCDGRWPEVLWESPNEIDWSFVKKFASEETGSENGNENG